MNMIMIFGKITDYYFFIIQKQKTKNKLNLFLINNIVTKKQFDDKIKMHNLTQVF